MRYSQIFKPLTGGITQTVVNDTGRDRGAPHNRTPRGFRLLSLDGKVDLKVHTLRHQPIAPDSEQCIEANPFPPRSVPRVSKIQILHRILHALLEKLDSLGGGVV